MGPKRKSGGGGSGKGKSRRTSGALRAEQRANGAFTIRVAFDGSAVSARGNALELGAHLRVPYATLKGKRITSASEFDDAYRTMERKGFRVTKDTGCLIPHAHYCTHAKGDIFKGYQRSFLAAFGFLPAQFEKNDTPRDEADRDLSAQLSHICHRRQCVRPDHVLFECKWRNFMRNNCLGPMVVNNRNACGCSAQFHLAGKDVSSEIPCIREYSLTKEELDPTISLCDSEEEVFCVLAETGFPFKYAFVDYADRDAISAARMARKAGDKGQALLDLSAIAQARREERRLSQVEEPENIQYDADPKTIYLQAEVEEE